jgi:hypothetical protein
LRLLFAVILPTPNDVISTEAGHSLIVPCAVEKSASLPGVVMKPTFNEHPPTPIDTPLPIADDYAIPLATNRKQKRTSPVPPLRSNHHAKALLLLLVALTTLAPTIALAQSLTIPQDVALRIRLDDTLTSTDSQVNDPFSATVMTEGQYQGARIYGHISSIDMSGRLQGRTEMVLQFDRLIMYDGRTARIHAEIIQLYHAPSHETLGVEGAILSAGKGRSALIGTGFGAGAGALMGAIFGGGKGAGIGSIIGGAAGLGTTAFRGAQKITLPSNLQMTIQIT